MEFMGFTEALCSRFEALTKRYNTPAQLHNQIAFYDPQLPASPIRGSIHLESDMDVGLALMDNFGKSTSFPVGSTSYDALRTS